MKTATLFDKEADYEGAHHTFPAAKERPVIAISGNYKEGECRLAEGYYASILQAGGTPLILPPYDNNEALLAALPAIDGLLLTGGGDINPLFMGEEPIQQLHSINARRDRQELLLTRLAADRQIPILGICRGLQVINAAFGGKLHQDIYIQAEATVKHDQDLERACASHTIVIEKESLLHRIFGKRQLAVNSFHHQAAAEAAPGFAVTAVAPDGIIEGIESTEYKSIIGVQWHPECFILNRDECMAPLFNWFIGEATSFAQAKRLHQRVLTLDSHCDTPMFFDRKINFYSRDPQLCVDRHKMEEGHLDATIMVAYLKQGERDKDTLQATTAKTNHILDEIEAMAAAGKGSIAIARTPQELYLNKQHGIKSIMMGIENGYAIGADIENVQRFRERGIVYMTLCHNGDNDLCDSAKGKSEHHGLSDFGRKVIAEMNRTGMMVDLSHASEESFYQAIEASSTPIVCSHSSCRALCNHPRNLTDEQLRTLAACGGVAQITIYNGFLKEDETAALPDVVRHIKHAIEIAGIDHVGIGTDFDGDGGIPGCANASELINLTRALISEGLMQDELQKIWGGNFLRVMQQVQAAAQS